MAKIKYKNSSNKYSEIPIYSVSGSNNISQGTGESTENMMSQKAITDEVNGKNEVLVSGVNIKTINGQSVLGEGNIEIDFKIPSETLVISLNSNQSNNDSSLIGVNVVITNTTTKEELFRNTWNGNALVFEIPAAVSYSISVSSVEGYKKPGDQSYTSESGKIRSTSFTYLTEVLNVTLSSSDGGGSLGNQLITVTDTSMELQLIQSKGELKNYKIPHGINYRVSVNEVDGYNKPGDKTFLARQKTNNVEMVYEKLKTAKIKISKGIIDPASKITTEGDDVLQELLGKFRRCLGKSTEDNKMSICYLRDDNSNYYHDGSNANTYSGDEGDVFVYFPEFWYKGEENSLYWIINISLEEIPGYIHVYSSLVGAFKAVLSYNPEISDYLIKSLSPNNYNVNKSMETFSTYARSRGSGFHLIDYQQHCIIAWMFYARYKNTDSQTICGTGPYDKGGSSYSTGRTLEKGMTDTTPHEAFGDGGPVNFLGIEGCWGGCQEFIEGAHSVSGDGLIVYDKGDFHDQRFSQVGSLTKRIIYPGTESIAGGYMAKIKGGSYMDMIIAKDNGSGSSSTGFCDYQEMNIQITQVLTRGGSFVESEAGVSNLSCYFSNSSTPYSTITSRLAFDGEITVIDSPTEFKAITGFR